MEALWGWEILEAVKGTHKEGRKDTPLKGVSADTRSLRPGELFIALKGKNFDGHDFVPKALELGAAGVVVSRDMGDVLGRTEVLHVLVEDTSEALGMLARYYREKLPVRVIAVTGTNGKTTTKEMLHHILSPSFKMVSSPGNFNNHIGVPLTIFQLEPYHELAVIEMGTSSPGELRRLSRIAQPEIGVITNISQAHLDGLKNVEGVALAKAELLENISPEGTLIFNADNPWCQVIAQGFAGRLMSFGLHEPAHIKGEDVRESNGGLSFSVNGRHHAYLPTSGIHNLYNALATLAVCYALGLNLADLVQGFKDFSSPPMRMERRRVRGITIINDAYNANPSSMKAALKEYSKIKVSGRRFFVCGDMAELGQDSYRFHNELGQRISYSGIDLLFVIGNYASAVAQGAREGGMPKEKILEFNGNGSGREGLYNSVLERLRKGDALLLKASRCMRLEEFSQQIKDYLAKEKVRKPEPLHQNV